MEYFLTFSFNQGIIPLTTPLIDVWASDLRLDRALIVPYSRVPGNRKYCPG